ncbi:MAG: hypothetical protein V4591_00630 [Bdellovibrionota bacterium]
MKYKSETVEILNQHYAQFQEDTIGIALAILDRKHNRIVTAQTNVNCSSHVVNIDTKSDPYKNINFKMALYQIFP